MPIRRAQDSFASFDLKRNPAMRQAYQQCIKVAESKARCALLVGSPGNGKTHLAVAAMNRYGMLRSMFWKVPDYLSWLRRMVYDEGRNIDDILRPYREQDFLLVLDDFGTENPTDWASEQMYLVLDSRCDEELPTIITTNVPRDRIAERLISRYRAGLVVCAGEDLR